MARARRELGPPMAHAPPAAIASCAKLTCCLLHVPAPACNGRQTLEGTGRARRPGLQPRSQRALARRHCPRCQAAARPRTARLTGFVHGKRGTQDSCTASSRSQITSSLAWLDAWFRTSAFARGLCLCPRLPGGQVPARVLCSTSAQAKTMHQVANQCARTSSNARCSWEPASTGAGWGNGNGDQHKRGGRSGDEGGGAAFASPRPHGVDGAADGGTPVPQHISWRGHRRPHTISTRTCSAQVLARSQAWPCRGARRAGWV